MSRIPLKKMVRIADNISALYQLGAISSVEKNELASCLQQGQEGFEALYLKTMSMEASEHDIMCSIRETIIFEN
jgi:hypothetical protein